MSPFLLLATGNLVLGGLVFLLGLVILRENPRQTLNRVVAFMLFFGGLGSFVTALGFVSTQGPGTAARGGVVAENFAYIWEFFFPTLLLFSSIFPQERGPRRRFRSFTLVVYAPHVFHFLLLLGISLLGSRVSLQSLHVPEATRPLVNVAGLPFHLFLAIHRSLFSLVNLGYGVLSAVFLIRSYREAHLPRLKRQLRVIGAGLIACLALYSLATSIPVLLDLAIPVWARSLLTIAALTVGSGSIAYAMVRYKFLDTKLLARRGILYAVASAVLIGFYLTVVTRLSQLVSSVSGVETRVLEPVFLILALILFQPVISRVEERLELMLIRDRGDYRNVLRRMGRELLTAIDLNEMLAQSIGTLSEVLLLRSAYAVAFTREGPVLQVGAGKVPGREAVAQLAGLLARVPLDQDSVRLDEDFAPLPPEDRDLLVGEFHAALVFPLHSKGETVGGLLLGLKATDTGYNAEDVNLLSTLAGQMSVSVQNGLLLRERVAVARMEEELNLARRIQSTFLPSEFPVMPRFEVYGMNTPSREVGGDFFDLVPLKDGTFYLAIADVSGKGVPAALLTSMLQASLRIQAETTESVASIVTNINTLVARSTTTEQFATFFLCRVDQESLRMEFSNAGHNYPLVCRKDGERVFLEKGGIVLGLMTAARFEEARLDLRPGDRVVFYTDGVNEAMNRAGEDFGEERLWDLVAGLPSDLSAREMTNRVVEELYRFLDGEEPQDDVTVMILRVLEGSPAERTREETQVGADMA